MVSKGSRLAASSRGVRRFGRDDLLSVSVLNSGTEHPLLHTSADDSEAELAGEPL